MAGLHCRIFMRSADSSPVSSKSRFRKMAVPATWLKKHDFDSEWPGCMAEFSCEALIRLLCPRNRDFRKMADPATWLKKHDFDSEWPGCIAEFSCEALILLLCPRNRDFRKIYIYYNIF